MHDADELPLTPRHHHSTTPPQRDREHRRRRMRRHGRRAYVRSVYFLPSLATLGNAVCGFGAMYIAAMAATGINSDMGPLVYRDPVAKWLGIHPFAAAAYLIFLAMIFDALDGRLARFTRHTTDFGGQLDSLADVVSFGAAPAFIALQVFKLQGPEVWLPVSRLVWAIGAIYFSCAALRLARFNVSNEHGEQHHYSFVGLPRRGGRVHPDAAGPALQPLRQPLRPVHLAAADHRARHRVADGQRHPLPAPGQPLPARQALARAFVARAGVDPAARRVAPVHAGI